MKIVNIVTRPFALLFKEPYHWAGRVDLGAVNVLLEVHTDEKIVGYGECIAARSAQAVVGALQSIKPLLIGSSPFDIEKLLHQARFLGGFNYTPRFANLTLAGLEMALWDLIGKSVNRPIYQLLGGAFHSEIDYFGFVQGDTAQELGEHAKQLVEQGYSVFYLKVGRGEQADMENTSVVRSVIGDRKLRLDANEAWDPCSAIYMIRRLEQFEPEFIEQPTPAGSIPALLQVKRSINIAVAADQSAFTLYDVYDICRQGAADVIVLSFQETGGLLAFKKAAAVAQAAGISICLHGQSVTGMTDLAQHQVGLTIPNLTDGNQIMHQLLVEDILAAPNLTPENGKLGVFEERPGLGFELNWDALERSSERYLQDPYFHHS